MLENYYWKSPRRGLEQNVCFKLLQSRYASCKNLVTKYYKRAYRSIAMFWINALFLVTIFNHLESVMDSTVAVTNCERTSLFVKQHFDRLKYNSGDLDLNHNCNYLLNESNRDPTYEGFLDASKYIDEKQELNSLFYLYFNKKLDNFKKTKVHAEHKIDDTIDGDCKNVYCEKTFC